MSGRSYPSPIAPPHMGSMTSSASAHALEAAAGRGEASPQGVATASAGSAAAMPVDGAAIRRLLQLTHRAAPPPLRSWAAGCPSCMTARSLAGSVSRLELRRRIRQSRRLQSIIGRPASSLAIDGFFSSLKIERTAREAHRACKEASADAFDDVERSHNARRRHFSCLPQFHRIRSARENLACCSKNRQQATDPYKPASLSLSYNLSGSAHDHRLAEVGAAPPGLLIQRIGNHRIGDTSSCSAGAV